MTGRLLILLVSVGLGTLPSLGARDTPDLRGLARELARIDAAGPADLRRATEVAGAVDRVLLAASERPRGSHEPPSLSTAMRALVSRYPVTDSARVDETLRVLSREPVGLRTSIARLIYAFLSFDAAARVFDPALSARIMRARADLLAAATGFAALIANAVPVSADLCPALALDLAGVASTYTNHCALTIEAGGDDTYVNNAGGNETLGAAAVVDLAGDDVYRGVGKGTNGGALVGAGFLLDLAGDDSYVAGGDGTNGGGYLGLGYLLDAAGDDRYVAGPRGTNGGGYLSGVGTLIDLDGTDSYEGGIARSYALGTNGGAAYDGTGILVDLGRAGRQTVRSEGDEGANGGAFFASTAFLFVASGDTEYVADSLGTNGGSDRSVAALVDGAGNDRYVAGSGGVNGGGANGGGLLLDLGGTAEFLDIEPDPNNGSGWNRTLCPKGTGCQMHRDDL